MANTLAIEANFVCASVDEMVWTIAFSAGWVLTVVFNKNLVFPKTKKAGDGLNDTDSVMSETIINVGRVRVFSSAIMNDFTEGRKAFHYCKFRQCERSVVDS